MKVLTNVIPHAAGNEPDKSSAIIASLVDAIPTILGEPANNDTLEYPQQEKEDLIASVMTCLVSSVKLGANTVLKNNKETSKQVLGVAIQMMKDFPHHPQIVHNGCLVLRGVCPHLTKSERKRYGVVAALGGVVASEAMTDKKVKDIADTILEEQFK
jgi:hypothetical protein